ncbi:hypothetical protein DOK67_0002989 [Enterococcus sp. DIV0212c]|uniref:hypothetical protein n=1 Tax=Enterococcus sp. DIV0212c TaxID=2230867 RepID=UPI001A9A845D|nr:hypothetical protein [Enterococcus sp. DIV0212c]MBO1354858.1 hypothetical protein [Enterococcus sp. DIV0212c]
MKKSICLLFSTILLGSFVAMPVTSFAQDKSNPPRIEQQDSNENFDYYENSPYFKIDKGSFNNDTIVTISDSDLIQLLKNQGVDTSNFKLPMTRANGVSKIVWHGAARNGNVDVYLSKNVLNGMLNIGVGGIAAIIATVLPGIGTAVGSVVATTIAGHGLFNNGVIYKIRGFGLSTIVYQ